MFNKTCVAGKSLWKIKFSYWGNNRSH